MSFLRELRKLINTQGKENASNTPDFILAEYMASCLTAYETAVVERDRLAQAKAPKHDNESDTPG